MITCYSRTTRKPVPGDLTEALATGDIVWIDALNGSDAELAAVEKATGLAAPSLASLSEIEHSSRMRRQGDAIVLSLPLPRHTEHGTGLLPIGFVVTKDLLLTVRFDEEAIFDDFAADFARGLPGDASATSVLTGIFEAIVDTMADRLEVIGNRLDMMAGEVLARNEGDPKAKKKGKNEDVPLRQLLREIGKIGQGLGKCRASLLAAGRIVPYVASEGAPWFTDGTSGRIGIVKADITSLDEYETHLADKVQFLLDAALGLINMEQNDLFKILTIVSVVGIPPTLIASIYGMNYDNMPELHWAFGYPYGLAMIALSAAIPLLWFKVKGWF